MDLTNFNLSIFFILILFILGYKRVESLVIINKIDKLEFLWVDDYFRNDTMIQFNTFIDTIISVGVINKSNKVIKIRLDKNEIYLNSIFFEEDRNVEESSFIFRVYDESSTEIFFNSGFLNRENSVFDINELMDLSEYFQIQPNQEVIFTQRIKLPILKSFYFDNLPKEDFSRVRFGKICLFTGKENDIPGSQKVFCSEPFNIVLKY